MFVANIVFIDSTDGKKFSSYDEVLHFLSSYKSEADNIAKVLVEQVP